MIVDRAIGDGECEDDRVTSVMEMVMFIVKWRKVLLQLAVLSLLSEWAMQLLMR
jgi:hypothetical protein